MSIGTRSVQVHPRHIVSARCELFAKQGGAQGPCTLAVRERQSFVFGELTERVMILFVIAMVL